MSKLESYDKNINETDIENTENVKILGLTFELIEKNNADI